MSPPSQLDHPVDQLALQPKYCRPKTCTSKTALLSLRLPNDVWDKILCHLNIITITKCRMISTQLHQVAYQVLCRFRQVSLFKLFSEMRERPTKDDMIQTLNTLPELNHLTIGIPEAFFKFNVADTFCETHVSTTLQSVVFYGCALQSSHFLNFMTRCKSVINISLCTHDSIDDKLVSDLIVHCHQFFIQNNGTKRRLERFELCAVKKVSKEVLAQLTDGFVADTIRLQSLGQLDHAELGVRQPTENALSLVNAVDTPKERVSHFEMRTNPHLRRLTIGENGLLSGRQIGSMDISRCPLINIRFLSSSQQPLGIKRLSITYGRWLSKFHCDMSNAFANLEHLDLTSSDALKATSIEELFGLGDSSEIKMPRLKTLVLCDTLVENLSLSGYQSLYKVDTQRCVMLQSVIINECPSLIDLDMDLGRAPALELLDITVPGPCIVKGIPEFITVNAKGGSDENTPESTRSFHFSISSPH